MSQASIVEFLEKYKKSRRFKDKKWLSVREIHDMIKDTEEGPAIASITVSVKKLRDSGAINFKEIPLQTSRAVMHYQSK